MNVTIQIGPSGGGCRHVIVRNAATNEVLLGTTIDELQAFRQTPSGGTILQQAAVLLLNAPANQVDTLPHIKAFLESRKFLEPEVG